MDGVLVDSMPYHFISWFEALNQYGIRVTPFDIYQKEGEKCDTCIKYFFKREGLPLKASLIDKILKLRDNLFRKYFKLLLFKEVTAVIEKLKKQNILLAIVTGSTRNKVVSILPKKLIKSFDVIIAADSLTRGKPYPDPYLMAAEKLKLKPSQCLVIENAPYGITAAKAAKMYCIAVTTSLPKQYLKKADRIYNKLSDIFK